MNPIKLLERLSEVFSIDLSPESLGADLTKTLLAVKVEVYQLQDGGVLKAYPLAHKQFLADLVLVGVEI